jgi:hypothetical protein
MIVELEKLACMAGVLRVGVNAMLMMMEHGCKYLGPVSETG